MIGFENRFEFGYVLEEILRMFTMDNLHIAHKNNNIWK